MPLLFCHLSPILHVIANLAIALVKLPCYIVRLESRLIGLFAFQEDHYSLIVASLCVAREYWCLGLGTCILDYMEKITRRMNKIRLGVDVLKKNVPAKRFYTRHGFTFDYDMRDKRSPFAATEATR